MRHLIPEDLVVELARTVVKLHGAGHGDDLAPESGELRRRERREVCDVSSSPDGDDVTPLRSSFTDVRIDVVTLEDTRTVLGFLWATFIAHRALDPREPLVPVFWPWHEPRLPFPAPCVEPPPAG